MKTGALIYILPIIGIAQAVENSVSINVKNAINTISDKFISHEVSFTDLMNSYEHQNSLKNLSVISPAFIKLRGFSSFLKNAPNKKFNEASIAELMETLK